jgi:hypothetical protein
LKKFSQLLIVAMFAFGAGLMLEVTVAQAKMSKLEKAFLKEMVGHSKKIKAYIKGHPNLKRERRLGNHETVEFLAIAIQDLAKRAPSVLKSSAKKDRAKLVQRARAVRKHARDIERAALTGSKEKIMAAYEGLDPKLEALSQ